MIDALIAGMLAGWGVAIPLGAIGVMVVDLGVRGGFRPAAAAAAGVATADLLYAGVAAAAGAAASAVLAPHEEALRWLSAAVLAGLGVYGLRAALSQARDTRGARGAVPGDAAKPADAAASGGGHVYARFVALTSINPLTVAYFAALIAGLPAIASAPATAKVAFVLAAGAASLSWQLVLAGAGAALHHRLPPSARVYTALAGNAIVLALAARAALGT
jgi:threonine/homoserine/homoserine lactone efflux protein